MSRGKMPHFQLLALPLDCASTLVCTLHENRVEILPLNAASPAASFFKHSVMSWMGVHRVYF